MEEAAAGLGSFLRVPQVAGLLVIPFVLLVLLGAQFLIGFRVLNPHRRFKLVHVGIAAVIGVLFLWHGFSPLVRLTDPAALWRFMVLPVGLILVGLLALQALVGYRVIPTHRNFRRVHLSIAIALVGLGAIHGVYVGLGLAHPAGSDRCETCHRQPAAHFGTPCVRCHRAAGVSWDFSHPAIPAPLFHAQFPCAQCHPRGRFTTVNCTCHANGTAGDSGG